eukprot:CAMPEP_0198316830 /NCGR_PEP_ID=MMETSP1450-20131203/6569_1 /TAXON_ID=753684 ORGANISM="Madagascaria erythrocladiodes, Strain CCMP3234" /NCGR_SAMPLE_ID=MMETSP1450 /ASSEMBLY_ACC=CAM_ASM_001115 /LENGTH=352 /DNA_ID=CAMNT_0044020001 /DNA_START=74 /DNA_END=1132 /DNA_ORIENTATION=+
MPFENYGYALWAGAAVAAAAASAAVAFVVRLRVNMQGYLITKYNEHRPDLTGMVALVTGASRGTGLEVAKELARRGATVVIIARPSPRLQAAAVAVRNVARGGAGAVVVQPLDFARVDDIVSFARRFRSTPLAGMAQPRLDILVNNAGIFGSDHFRTHERLGVELTFAINHVAPYLLTKLLLPLLKQAERGARVVNVSSGAHQNAALADATTAATYTRATAYGKSKLANLMHARVLQDDLDSSARDGQVPKAVSCTPGLAYTNLLQDTKDVPPLIKPIVWLISRSAWGGAQVMLHCALAPSATLAGGGYYSNCLPREIFGKDKCGRDKKACVQLCADTDQLLRAAGVDLSTA